MSVPSWADCHAAGLTATAAAAARGRHYSAAYAWAKRRGLQWAPEKRRWTPVDDAYLRRAYPTAMPTAVIAKMLGRDPAAVHRRAEVLGLAGLAARRRAGRAQASVSMRRRARVADRVAWAAARGLTIRDTQRLFGIDPANIHMVARRDGLAFPDGRGLERGERGYLRRLARAVRASLGACGYVPPEVEALIPIVMDHLEAAA